MSKYIFLFGGILVILLAFLALYSLLGPRVGPIGNGPPIKLIWFFFSVQVLSGLGLLILSFLKFREEKMSKE